MKKKKLRNRFSLSMVMTGVVVALVFLLLLLVLSFFVNLYDISITQSAVTSSEQAVRQVVNTVENYTNDMAEDIQMIMDCMKIPVEERTAFLESFLDIRSDVVLITVYDMDGVFMEGWAAGYDLKADPYTDLSYASVASADGSFYISEPHVESLLINYYPWVVTVSQKTTDETGHEVLVCMDIRFSDIVSYVDDVGIGQHGYCFILDTDSNLIYHPQQQLIYAGLKEEEVESLRNIEDGSNVVSNVIYTVETLETCNWRVVGVSYVDEQITVKVENMIQVFCVILLLMLLTAVLVGSLFSWIFARPMKRLTSAMGAFERNAENFSFEPVQGTSEIAVLSDSFGHMVLQIQQLMEQVREEEISLRKTELKALQAQINPHFLYNTLDSISWMCEEGRSEEAEEMVNALGRLFRISISRGEELIPLGKELQHAQSYLKIQSYRYKNQFTYEFHVEENCLQYYCNKITLQPIIENSIYHGIEGMVDTGRIDIGIQEEEEGILMWVEDNGIGMSEEQCREILRREAGDRTGIGIKNVNDRIQIYFGDSYGLTIHSVPDEGTRVEIRIPKMKEGEYEIK